MTKNAIRKFTLSYLIKTSFILFINIILSGCSSNQNKTQQSNPVADSLNTVKISEKLKTDSIIPQKKEESKKPSIQPVSTHKELISSPLPDFTSYKNVKQKKSAFFSFIMPLIQNENKSILSQRQFIEKQYQLFKLKDTLKTKNSALLKKYIVSYRCKNTDLSQAKTFDELLIRVDIIPQELALVQAALESSWGSSYFARSANNLFGQWCFKPGCGVIPRARKEGEIHEVAKFETLQLSVESYMLFLNSHPAFSLLRKERAVNRRQGENPNALLMANGLKDYSARGNAYISEVKSMIRTNKEFINSSHIKDNVLSISNKDNAKSN
jgi:Bax protein